MQSLPQLKKDLGVVYSPEILVNYICQTTIHQYIIERLNDTGDLEISPPFTILEDENLESEIQDAINIILSEIKIIDPAVGVGYFLQSSFDVLEDLHNTLIKANIQERAITDIVENTIVKSLFGVDISQQSVNSCIERLHKYITSRYPTIDANRLKKTLKKQIKTGNALIGNTFNKSMTSSTEEHILSFDWDKEFPGVSHAGGFSICVGNPPWNILKPLEKEFFSQYDSQLSKYGVDKQEAQLIVINLLKDTRISSKWVNYRSEIQKQAKYFKKYYKYQSGLINFGKNSKRISGDLNLYKLFLERSFLLLQRNGISGMIIPSGIHSDAGTKGLRTLLFDHHQVLKLIAFENRQGIFPSIHKSFKFDILIYQKNYRITDIFQSAFMKKDPSFLTYRNVKLMELSWQKIKEYSPSSWSILEFKTEQDLSIVKKMYKFPVIGDSIAFARELDMSMDSHFFNSEKKGVPIYEGKMIHQYDHLFKDPRYWIEEEQRNKKFSLSYTNFREIRLVFRAVAASTNQRTMISTLIPPNCCCGNSLIIINDFSRPNSHQTTLQDLLFLVGVFNSFVFDYLLRLKISQNLNMFFIRDLPLPKIIDSDKSYQRIINLVSSIYSDYEEFRLILNTNFPKSQKYSNLYMTEKQALSDAEVAKLYELSLSNLEYILDQFHIRDIEKENQLNQQKRLILEHYNSN
ncbi:MAG: Eco57I restriction-modification methylase domain-containing protein [Candidatus Hodarchaeales archaeon]|jgi:Alw26I/Eco31I/Esp3I family type II restriction m6 adenine DNA methyltransferase